MAETLQVAMYNPTARGGHARYTHELLEALAAKTPVSEIGVHLVTSKNLEPDYRTSSYPIHDIFPPLTLRSSYRSRLRWIVSRFLFYTRREWTFTHWLRRHPDIRLIHVQEIAPWTAVILFPVLRRRKTYVIATVHNIIMHTYPLHIPSFLPEFLDRRGWRSAQGLIVHSEVLKDDLARFLGAGHPPIFVAEHGLWDRDHPKSLPGVEERLARRHLVFFGVIAPYKGVLVLLDALRDLPDVTLTIAGRCDDPALLEGIRARIACVPGGRVTFENRYLDDAELPGLFANATIAVFPYRWFQAQSGAMHDAVTNEVPVVGTDVGAIGGTIRNWDIGEVAQPNDPTSLANAIRTLLEPVRYRRAIAGVRRAISEHGWDQTAASTLAAYEAVMHGRH